MFLSDRLERALRRAAEWHRPQTRKGSTTPYIEHPFAVAWILDRAGFAEDVLIAGLLHDAVEDTDATLQEIGEEFGAEVAAIVAECSERKTDETGRKRPWIDRKREHLEEVERASREARAVVLADKLHNLTSIRVDLAAGGDVWSKFNAGRDEVLWYHRAMIAACDDGDPRLRTLAEAARKALADLEHKTH